MAWSPTQVSPEPCSAWPTAAPTALSPGSTPRTASQRAHGCPAATANRGLVVRVGDTVVRPTAPCRRATHALLAHLAAVGFEGAPRVLAAGTATETLTYMDGQAAVRRWPEDTLTDAALVSVADLVRRYHLAAASFDPAGYQWPRPIPARFRTGLVSHNDVHPANLVFRDGPGRRTDRLRPGRAGQRHLGLRRGRALWCAAAGRPDITDSRQGRALERFRIFLEASGLSRADRREVAEAVVANHDWTYAIVTEAAAAGPPGFRRPLARGGRNGRPGPPLVPAAPARPAGRGAMTRRFRRV